MWVHLSSLCHTRHPSLLPNCLLSWVQTPTPEVDTMAVYTPLTQLSPRGKGKLCDESLHLYPARYFCFSDRSLGNSLDVSGFSSSW